MVWLFWIGAALLLAVVETLTADLTFLMISGGAAGAGVAALLGGSLPVQVLVFAVVSTLLLLAVRPWARRRLAAGSPRLRTNVSALVGERATTITPVDSQGGRVRLVGGMWSARLAAGPENQGQPVRLDPGTEVVVTQIDGAVAVVAPLASVQPAGAAGAGSHSD